MSRRDTELKCDERVTAAMTEAERKEYAAMLVQQTTKRSVAGMQVMATGMSFTGKRLKERVKLVIGGKRAIKALSVVFMVLCCMLLVGSFATAEYSGRVVIPAFREGMLPAAQPVTTDEEAIALAGRIAALPQLQADTKDGQWSVRKENGNPGVKAVAWVNDNGEKTYHIRLYENGGIYGTVNSEKSYYSDDRLFINQQEPWQDDLADFIEQWILAMDPALEGKIEHAEYRYQFLLDGERYAYYEVPTDMEGAVYYYVTVKISPEFQIIECSPGNG